MLIRFNVENFLSFNKPIEFSLIANKEKRLRPHLVEAKNISILKTGVIYGANASGKSNLVEAISLSQRIILEGIARIDLSNKHYLLDSTNISKPTIFNYEIFTDDTFYSYGFATILSQETIIEEWLYEIGKGKDKLIFERTINENGLHKIEIGQTLTAEDRARFDVYKKDFEKSNKLLFLSEINRKSVEGTNAFIHYTNIYNWFKDRLTVLKTDSIFATLNLIPNDKTLTDVFENILRLFDTGIDGITSEHVEFEKIDMPSKFKEELRNELTSQPYLLFEINDKKYTLHKDNNGNLIVTNIKFEHFDKNGKSVIFDLENESEGTQRLLDFIPALHELKERNAVFVIDEIDRSLHSKLTYGIFELFLKLTQNNQSQLIATTHEGLLLDLNLLRRDEIWFVEKNEGESRLYSLDEFKERADKIIRKDYLLGRYGAIPIFKSFNSINI
jgi:AAA15 family ATPase/GTPase